MRNANGAPEIEGPLVAERARDRATVAGVVLGPAGQVLDGGNTVALATATDRNSTMHRPIITA